MSHGQHGPMEFARIHSQLQVSSARASHFLDAETCDFHRCLCCPWDIKVPYSHFYGLIF